MVTPFPIPRSQPEEDVHVEGVRLASATRAFSLERIGTDDFHVLKGLVEHADIRDGVAACAVVRGIVTRHADPLVAKWKIALQSKSAA